MKEVIASSETGMLGIAEMEELFSYIAAAGSTLDIELDLSLARVSTTIRAPFSR